MSTGSISGGQWYQGNLVYTPGRHLCHWVHLVLPEDGPALCGLMKEFELIILVRCSPLKGGCF